MIKVHNLKKQYGKKVALSGVNFTVDKGEVVGLLGLNGAGKSTIMNILTGYISATSGDVVIDGHNILEEAKEAKKVIGYLPEQLAFYKDMRVIEYLKFMCDLKGFGGTKKERNDHIDQICERVGLSHVKDRMIRNLSKGYRQRVGFAQALSNNPKVLILDEPTVGLDPAQITDIRELIREVGKTSTVIISSHILSEIQAICKRIIMIKDGTVVLDDSIDNIIRLINTNNKVIVRIQGEFEQIKAALSSIDNITQITKLPDREENTCDVSIEGEKDSDIRVDVFNALAKVNLPLLHTYGREFSLEDIFLYVIDEKLEKNHEEDNEGNNVTGVEEA